MFSNHDFVFMKTSIELNHKLKIVSGERMVEFEEKIVHSLEGKAPSLRLNWCSHPSYGKKKLSEG